jgi:hypothetical protein
MLRSAATRLRRLAAPIRQPCWAHLGEAVGVQDHLAVLGAQVVGDLAVGAKGGQALGVGHVGAQAQLAGGLHGDDGVVACTKGRRVCAVGSQQARRLACSEVDGVLRAGGVGARDLNNYRAEAAHR